MNFSTNNGCIIIRQLTAMNTATARKSGVVFYQIKRTYNLCIINSYQRETNINKKNNYKRNIFIRGDMR
jgi:hypothetical protein